MSRIRRILFLLTVVLLVIAAQQLIYFYMQWDRLTELKAESAHLAAQIESAMYEVGSLQQQLSREKAQQEQLRTQLPSELKAEQIEQLITKLAAAKRIKVLARTTATYTTPFYKEARIKLTLEANENQRKQFLAQIRKQPRIITISNAKTSGKKNAHYTFSVYALDSVITEPPSLPRCVDMPQGLIIPHFYDRLLAHYTGYRQQCQYVSQYGQYLLDQFYLGALTEENRRLITAIKKVREHR